MNLRYLTRLITKMVTLGNRLANNHNRVENVNNKRIAGWLIFVQVVGLIFYGVFSAVYILPLPSYEILTNDPVLNPLLAIFGGSFFVLTAISALIAVAKSQRIEQ